MSVGRSGVRSRRTERDRMARRADFRVGRGLVIGLALLGVSAAGHAAGGSLVEGPGLVLAAGAAVLVGIALSDREWRLPRLLVVLAAGQALMHLAMTAGHGAAAHGPARDGVGLASGGSPAAWQMLAGHAIALVVTAVVLRRGEDLVWRVAASLGSVLVGPMARSGRPARAPGTPLIGLLGLRSHDVVRHAVVRRGPPHVSCD